MVGAAGFEPATPWSQARYSTKLSHAPIANKKIIIRNGGFVNTFFMVYKKIYKST
jgi:hypothetical protein